MPGNTNSPERFNSFSASAVNSSKYSRAWVRLTSNRSAKCENSSDLPILRASDIGVPPGLTRVSGLRTARAERQPQDFFEKRRILVRASHACQSREMALLL